jgi:hypothetical protein
MVRRHATFPVATGSPTKEIRLSSSVMNRAARLPAWVGVALALVVVASTATVAGHRHDGSRPAPRASASMLDASAPVPDVRREPVSRSADRTRGRAVGQPLRRAAPLVRKPKPQLPVASSTAAQTVEAAEASTSNVPGHCLGWSREQADIPSRYTDAATAWEHAHGRRSGDPNPPKGAAVYWTGGSRGYGHIAISLGRGLVRSSDAGGAGVVATVPLRRLTQDWNLRYVGWADSINGYTIPGVAST